MNQIVPTQQIDVWVVDGQSNALGSTGSTSIPQDLVYPNPNAKIAGINNNSNSFNEVTNFVTLNHGNTSGNGSNALGFVHGAELSLAKAYSNKTVFIIKVAQGGTSLQQDWGVDSFLRNKLHFYVNYAKNFFEQNNISVRWIRYRNQWESDSGSDDRANNWGANLDSFDNDLFVNTGVVFDKYYHIKISENPNNRFYSLNQTRCNTMLSYLNQRALNDPNFFVISVDDLPLRDSVHLFSSGYIELGERLYNFSI